MVGGGDWTGLQQTEKCTWMPARHRPAFMLTSCRPRDHTSLIICALAAANDETSKLKIEDLRDMLNNIDEDE